MSTELRTKPQDDPRPGDLRAQVFLAGLGALLSRDAVFRRLVDRGSRLVEEDELLKTNPDLLAEMRHWLESSEPADALSTVESKTSRLFDELVERGRKVRSRSQGESFKGKNKQLDRQVAAVLQRLGVPSRIEIETLTGRVEELIKSRRDQIGPDIITARDLERERHARIARGALTEIWREPVLPPGQVAVALGAKETNREKASALRKRSSLLGLPRDRGFLYPAFQIDVSRREVFPAVRRVNETLGAADDPWGVASWWVSRNDRLAARPIDLVGSERADEVVRAAVSSVAPIG